MSTTRQDQLFNEIMKSHIEVSMSNASLDEAIDFISNEFSPDDVFDEKKLIAWAESNGYVKEDA